MIYNTYGEWNYLVFVTRINAPTVCVKTCAKEVGGKSAKFNVLKKCALLYVVSLVLRAVELKVHKIEIFLASILKCVIFLY